MTENIGPRRRALVVEDDEDIRSSVEECLQSADFETAGAPNGEAALAWLRAHDAPSLIVLDLMMPVMDGFDFRKAQLGDARLATIPVLLLTADGNVDKKCKDLGLTHGVKKPCDPGALVRAADDACKAE